VTIAPGGYANLMPKTTGGPMVGVGVILGGVGVLSIIMATRASVYVEKRRREKRDWNRQSPRAILSCGGRITGQRN